jgi:TatD DNase family protein
MTENVPVRGFDFHCHVDLHPSPAAMVASCDENQVVTIAVTTTPKAWSQNLRWTVHSRYVYAAVGLHPEVVAERHHEIQLLEEIMKETPFVGEIGLDGSPHHRKSLPMQTDVFIRALAAAQRLGRRVVSIHSRRAGADVLACIKERTTPDRVLPILHWFSDSVAVARQAINLDCFFSINLRMLDHASGMALVRSLPADRLLTETDAPFASVGDRPSEPPDVATMAERLASARGTSVPQIREILAANAGRVFAFAGIDAKFQLTQ